MYVYCKSGRFECECYLTGVIWESFDEEMAVILVKSQVKMESGGNTKGL
jgi:hypothetical protein